MRSRLGLPRVWWFAAVIFLTSQLGIREVRGQILNKDELRKGYDAADKDDRRKKLFTGEIAAKKTDEKLARDMANWYLYRITWDYNTDKYRREFSDEVDKLNDFGNTPAARNKRYFVNAYFAPALVAAMREMIGEDVLRESQQVIHGAQLLSIMARLRDDSITGYLAELVQDEKNVKDAVRLYALRAIKDTFPLTPQPDEGNLDLKDKAYLALKDREVKQVETLTRYVDRKINSQNMINGEIDAQRYLRREAIISLANAGSPAVLAVYLKKVPRHEGLVAPTLLRVLAGNLEFDYRLNLKIDAGLRKQIESAALSEKIEAALGLCAMKYPNMPEFNPDVAVYLVGETVLEFVRTYNQDWTKIKATGADKRLPYIPFKHDANRFKTALKQLHDNAPAGSPTQKNAAFLLTNLSEKPNSVLTKIAAYANASIEQTVVDAIRKMRPKSLAVFKNHKDASPLMLAAR